MKNLVMASLACVLSMSLVACFSTAPSAAYSEWQAQQQAPAQSSGSASDQTATERVRRAEAETLCRRNHPPGSDALNECIAGDASGGASIQAQAAARQAPAAQPQQPRPMAFNGFGYGGMPGASNVGVGFAPPIPAQRVLAGYVGVGASPADNEHIIRVYIQTRRWVAIRIGNDYVPIFRGSDQIWRQAASSDGVVRPVPVIPPGDEYTDIAVLRSGHFDVTLEFYAADADGTISLQRTERRPDVVTYPNIALVTAND